MGTLFCLSHLSDLQDTSASKTAGTARQGFTFVKPVYMVGRGDYDKVAPPKEKATASLL